jgi:2-polyprenyl-6-methoxyphenol hydroxylase-like FAD-dependent oxidoreductase
MQSYAASKKVLISGGGIAGLTLAILLKEKGWQPTIIERDPALRTEGYVIDFFGSGWDVAERMDLVDELRKISYPIETLRYVDEKGKPYLSLPVASVRNALGGRYTYLQRSDLERILFGRAKAVGLNVNFGATIESLQDTGTELVATLNNGAEESFALVFGADGVHSRVRELTFGREPQYARFLGYYVGAFHLENRNYDIGTALTISEGPDRALWVYSLSKSTLSAMYVFRHPNVGYVPPQDRLPLLRSAYRGAGWIAEDLLSDVASAVPVFFDAATQIVMPSWSKGRVALLGDACACLTLLAGQGSHLAMAEAYVLATELERYGVDYGAAFAAYEKALKAATIKKQKIAVRIAKYFVPAKNSFIPLRRMVERVFFNQWLIGTGLRFFGLKSVIAGYR